MIDMNEYWNASPLRPKSRSNTLLHCVFYFCRLLALEFQRLKIGCFKTAVLKNVWPCYRCSPGGGGGGVVCERVKCRSERVLDVSLAFSNFGSKTHWDHQPVVDQSVSCTWCSSDQSILLFINSLPLPNLTSVEDKRKLWIGQLI